MTQREKQKITKEEKRVNYFRKTTGWYHANKYNSTKFTDCCRVAVEGAGDACPICGARVTN